MPSDANQPSTGPKGPIKRRAGKRRAADRLAEEVNAYRREHDHPISDGRKLKLDYEAMLRALKHYLEA